MTVFQSISGRLPEIGRKRRAKIEESKNVQTTPTRTYCKRNRPLPYYGGQAHSYRKLLILIMAFASIKRPRPCQNDTDDDLGSPNFVFSGNDTFVRFLVIKSQDSSNPVTSLSPFVIEKQIESLIGTPKSVKKNRKIKLYWLKLTEKHRQKIS